MPAPTSEMAWFHSTRSTARNRPANMAPAWERDGRRPRRRCSSTARTPSTGSAKAQRYIAAVAGPVLANLIHIAEAEMQAAPRVASSMGDLPPPLAPGLRRPAVAQRPPRVMTVRAYGTDMPSLYLEAAA